MTAGDMDGVVSFLKPPGMSSHDAVAFLRRLMGIRRIGHTGTLDPMAAGVLPLCVGRATRLAEYLVASRKRYMCEMRLGLTTDTLDVWGTPTARAGASFREGLSEGLVADALRSLEGEREQKPPMYSAVKLGGKKLYEYARKGQSVDVPARTVYINKITVIGVDIEAASARFEVECSKGVYIRSICGEAGALLGCGAVMSGLVRIASGAFSIEDSFTAEELEAAFRDGRFAEAALIPLDAALEGFAAIRLSAGDGRRFADGVAVRLPGAAGPADGEPRRVYAPGKGQRPAFLGVGRLEGGLLRAEKVFGDKG
ncbi:MAG: tRNA pseudouridine(55) synthase TruB [Clostridiales Family XIII bacterium]|jgi:tRNA pseudouridine55 synthase|nr:tRNA pseudouridine(55) synthase TruB [Clostridiales Family XIII bacterium]